MRCRRRRRRCTAVAALRSLICVQQLSGRIHRQQITRIARYSFCQLRGGRRPSQGHSVQLCPSFHESTVYELQTIARSRSIARTVDGLLVWLAHCAVCHRLNIAAISDIQRVSRNNTHKDSLMYKSLQWKVLLFMDDVIDKPEMTSHYVLWQSVATLSGDRTISLTYLLVVYIVRLNGHMLAETRLRVVQLWRHVQSVDVSRWSTRRQNYRARGACAPNNYIGGHWHR